MQGERPQVSQLRGRSCCVLHGRLGMPHNPLERFLHGEPALSAGGDVCGDRLVYGVGGVDGESSGLDLFPGGGFGGNQFGGEFGGHRGILRGGAAFAS